MRKFGYSIRGIPPVDHRLLIRGIRYSALPVMSASGIYDVFIGEGTIGLTIFIREYLIPVLMPFNGVNPGDSFSSISEDNHEGK